MYWSTKLKYISNKKPVLDRILPRIDLFSFCLQPDETELEVQRGDDVQIICPSNHHSNSASERSLCSFISPVGKKYQIVGK